MLRYTENVHSEVLSRGIDLLELLALPISQHLSSHPLSLISTYRKRVRHKQCQLRRANGIVPKVCSIRSGSVPVYSAICGTFT
jgi:hypothetical protein